MVFGLMALATFPVPWRCMPASSMRAILPTCSTSLIGEGQLKLDFEDEITRGCCVTHAGKVVNERARQMMEAVTAHQGIQKEVSR